MVSQRQDMISIPAPTHTRHRSVCRRQGRDECTKGAPSTMLSSRQLMGLCGCARSDNGSPLPCDCLSNLHVSLARQEFSSVMKRCDESLRNSAWSRAFLSCLCSPPVCGQEQVEHVNQTCSGIKRAIIHRLGFRHLTCSCGGSEDGLLCFFIYLPALPPPGWP